MFMTVRPNLTVLGYEQGGRPTGRWGEQKDILGAVVLLCVVDGGMGLTRRGNVRHRHTTRP